MIPSVKSIAEIYSEAQSFFMGQGKLNNALTQLVADLNERRIDYLVIGAIALVAHGYVRFTEDIDLILTREGMERFNQELVGLGYVPAFTGARKRFKSSRDNSLIELIAAGEYPGDGRPKPIRFPDPREDAVTIDGIRFPTIEKLMELKLASGMTAADRLKDLADVQELIKVNQLSSDFAQRLDPYVRKKYLELCIAVTEARRNNIQE